MSWKHAVYIQPATQGHFPHPQKIYFGKDNRKSRRQIAATLSVECECSAVRASYSTASSFAQLTLSKTRTQGAIIGLVEQKGTEYSVLFKKIHDKKNITESWISRTNQFQSPTLAARKAPLQLRSYSRRLETIVAEHANHVGSVQPFPSCAIPLFTSDFAVLRPSASSFGSHAGFGVNLMSIDGATNVFQAYAMLQSIQ
ncbi:uncharacterized protein CIMG_11913 [Coccidioides immitis RS]|uniref:Uncharacterized protein n=1 Tax=Coccidioides immitis (strain RS) TaxID=246410 RepID=A0A0D8JU83_COCIM|nr:uncharacterized protein CIMG_11913 [Coccidioides immitis RS]KJF60669.1 hypothetical protein CIMG_11913 [Coccidioides immitis RS]